MYNLHNIAVRFSVFSLFNLSLILFALIHTNTLFFSEQANAQQRVSSCPYNTKAMCEVCTTNKVCAWRNCCKNHSAQKKVKKKSNYVKSVAAPMCVNKCNRRHSTATAKNACYAKCSKRVKIKPVIAEINKDAMNEAAGKSSSDEPQEMIVAIPEAQPKGGVGSPAIGGGKLSGGDKQVVRYSCCDDVIIRKGASAKTNNIGKLMEGEQVWVQYLLPSTGLKSAFTEAEDCYKNGKNCKNAITKLTDYSKINYYAKIFAVKQGKTG
ncbi:MAG: hypothetical protein GWO07_03845 [Candidatus Dadabacteria bacterium]|nr:hypothetical protein [Candidatus Dadabacteria bacterium]NIV42922.1 hypothetical protein [Candidatus Dadabacteria bacterium]NIX14886.1 hypothetical protein [Candidatus Dadabacteria bacterium]